MILVSSNIRYMRILLGFLGEGRRTTAGLWKSVIFIFLLAICSETLDRICRIYIEDIHYTAFQRLFWVILNFMTLN